MAAPVFLNKTVLALFAVDKKNAAEVEFLGTRPSAFTGTKWISALLLNYKTYLTFQETMFMCNFQYLYVTEEN